MGERNRHVGLGAAPKLDRTEPYFVGNGLNEARILRKVSVTADRIRLEPGDFELLFPLAVEIGQLGDRRDLPQEPNKIGAPLIRLSAPPLDAGCPSELSLDFSEEFVDPNSGRSRFFLLNLQRSSLGLIIVQPGINGAVDQEYEYDQSDQRRGKFCGKGRTPYAARCGPWRARLRNRRGRAK